VRKAWTTACYWSFTRGYEEVCREWPANLEFDWLNLCTRLREKWFYIPVNVGWNGIENWGQGKGAGVDLDDLLPVFKNCRNATSRTEVQNHMESKLRTGPLGEQAVLFFREALEVGVYPKTVFLEDLPDPEIGRIVKHKVLRWVVDRVLEAGKKFPEAETDVLVLGVYFSPGPVLEQSEASMWECYEYIRRLGDGDAARKESRNSVLSYLSCESESCGRAPSSCRVGRLRYLDGRTRLARSAGHAL
jgi:hypothetical protein